MSRYPRTEEGNFNCTAVPELSKPSGLALAPLRRVQNRVDRLLAISRSGSAEAAPYIGGYGESGIPVRAKRAGHTSETRSRYKTRGYISIPAPGRPRTLTWLQVENCRSAAGKASRLPAYSSTRRFCWLRFWMPDPEWCSSAGPWRAYHHR